MVVLLLVLLLGVAKVWACPVHDLASSIGHAAWLLMLMLMLMLLLLVMLLLSKLPLVPRILSLLLLLLLLLDHRMGARPRLDLLDRVVGKHAVRMHAVRVPRPPRRRCAVATSGAADARPEIVNNHR